MCEVGEDGQGRERRRRGRTDVHLYRDGERGVKEEERINHENSCGLKEASCG